MEKNNTNNCKKLSAVRIAFEDFSLRLSIRYKDKYMISDIVILPKEITFNLRTNSDEYRYGLFEKEEDYNGQFKGNLWVLVGPPNSEADYYYIIEKKLTHMEIQSFNKFCG